MPELIDVTPGSPEWPCCPCCIGDNCAGIHDEACDIHQVSETT